MTIEEEIFETARYEETKLLNYGFKKQKQNFYYETTIYHGEFSVSLFPCL